MTVVGNTMNVRYRAIPASVPLARHALGDLAAAAGASAEKVEAIRLAVSEAMTNAVLHAYPQASGIVDVTAAVASGELWVLIADDGRGLHARSGSPGLGLGLVLISQEADSFEVGPRGSGGTEVRMRFDLGTRDGEGAREGQRTPEDRWSRAQLRGSVAAASRPASARFSTTT